MTTYNGPMSDQRVVATNRAGAGATGTTDAKGIAILHVPKGTYTVQACEAPSTITASPSTTANVDLVCAAP